MKHILTPAVEEKYEYLCDVTKRPAFACLYLDFWWGSEHDGQYLRAELCDETAKDILKMIQEKYPNLVLRGH